MNRPPCNTQKLGSIVEHQPDPRDLKEHHKHSDTKIDVSSCFSRGSSGNPEAALPEKHYQRSFMSKNVIGNGTVESYNQQTKRQPAEFDKHRLMLFGWVQALNRGNDLKCQVNFNDILLLMTGTAGICAFVPGKSTSDPLACYNFEHYTMHPDLERLIELQRLDSEIATLRAEVAALPQRVSAIEAKLATTMAHVERAKSAAKETEKSRRKHEADIQTLQQKISKYRDQMLGVKTNEEYKALLNEIGFAERDIRAAEDKILDGMLETETRDKEINAAEKLLADERAEVEKEKNDARSRTAEDQKRLAELKPRREAVRKEVDPDLLYRYDRVLKARGSALSEAREEKCLTCHVMLRPQVYNDVLTGKVMTCDSCGRILYYDRSKDAEPTPQAVAVSAPAETNDDIQSTPEQD